MRKSTKRILCAVFILIGFLILNPQQAMAETNINLNMNGRIFVATDTGFFLDESAGRIMVPINFCTEGLEMNVSWNESKQIININKGRREITLKISDSTGIIDGEKVVLEIPATSINGRVYLPLRFICESFELEVKWDDEKKTVFLINPERQANTVDEWDRNLWNKTVKQYLRDELWLERDIYDAGHYAMVPLHAAFYFHEYEWQKDFAEHLERFVNNKGKSADGCLNRLHYYYLASRFIVLAQETGNSDLIPPGLVELLYEYIENIWMNEPAWQWGRQPFDGGISERLEWKLNNHDIKKSYYRAIIDEELFTFAIAADLRNYENISGKYNEKSVVVTEILDMAYEVFTQEIEWQNDGGWLFQPGVRSDHPDYAFAGNKEKRIGIKPYPIDNIACDSSHSHRLPLILTSLCQAYSGNSNLGNYYEELRKGLGIQFCNKVLVLPNSDFGGYRTNNFMDGNNGVYRWGYATQGKNNGYGPYELSGTLFLGWWTFLPSNEINNVYQNISDSFPLSKEVIDLYVGPNTSRERNLLVIDPQSYYNGYRELIVRLAAKIEMN